MMNKNKAKNQTLHFLFKNRYCHNKLIHNPEIHLNLKKKKNSTFKNLFSIDAKHQQQCA